MNDAERRFAEASASVKATLLIDGRIEAIEAEAPDLLGLYRPLMERAAEMRLAGAFWRMIGPT